MTPLERGILLLTSHLGDPDRRALTTAQLRTLADRVHYAQRSQEDRQLQPEDLMALGYGRDMARRIVELLSQEAELDYYLQRAARAGCVPITRCSPDYPVLLRQRLGLDSPGCLWARGDVSILSTPTVSLVGSRELREPNRAFAQTLGLYAADRGLTLVSGNARGADRTAQQSCQQAGGRIISIVAEELDKQAPVRNVLYLSEEDFDAPFSTPRALSRNRCIHALGRMVFVAQADYQKGGTWDGTVKNLRFGWSPVAVFRDGSDSARELEQMGAYLVGEEDMRDFDSLPQLGATMEGW